MKAGRRPEDGFLTRRRLVESYAEAGGRNVSDMGWYVVFGYFKLAGILQQIYARYHKGQTTDDRFAAFGGHARNLITHAENLTRADGF